MSYEQSIESTELRAEIERLRAERDDLFKTNGELANSIGAENLRLRAALLHSRTFLKTYQRSNANWHNDGPTRDFIRTVIDPVIGDDEQKADGK